MLKIFQYRSHEITFDFGNGEIMVNATEMAKPFGKLPKDFLRTQPTQEYITALSVRTRILTTDLVRVIQGGDARTQGTWLHRRLALRFAQWLSPDFAVWVDEKLEELLTTGSTSLEPVQPAQPLSILDMMELSIQLHRANDKRLAAVESTVHRIEAKVSDINTDYFTLSGYYALKGRKFDLSNSEAIQTGKRLSKASQMNGFSVGKTYSAKYGQVGTYHLDILKAVLGF